MNYKANLESNKLPINEKSHEKVIEHTFSISLMADCTVNAFTVQLTNYIFCCIHDNLSLYPGIVIWEVHGAYSAPVPAKRTHHMESAAVSLEGRWGGGKDELKQI